MFKKIFLSLSLSMSVVQAQVKTIATVSEVKKYVTHTSWVVWDLEGTLFQFKDNIPFEWLTKDTKQVFNKVKNEAKKVVSLTGSYSYLYLPIASQLVTLDAQFSFDASKDDQVIYLNKLFQSFLYNGVAYSGLQSKGVAFVQYLKLFEEKDLPDHVVFIDDTEKHAQSVAEEMQKAFPKIKTICLYYHSK